MAALEMERRAARPGPGAPQGESMDPQRVWGEYERARAFNQAIELYETVEKNENFYIGDQWHGVNAPDLDKPVFNILGRVVKFFISSIMSDDIGVSVERFDENAQAKPVLEMLGAQFDEVMELTAYKKKCREIIRNAAVDGDGCMHFYFDAPPPREEEQALEEARFEETPGEIKAEIIENTCLHFGNPQSSDLQEQPYLLLNYRRIVEEVRKTAADHGCDPEEIQPDEDQDKHGDAPEEGKVTVVRRYWKRDGHVWCCEVCAGGAVRPPWDTGYTRYPVAFLPWEKVKNQYHGQAALTGLIPNQIFINKLYALAMQHVKSMAFPKIVYNRNLLPGGWDNRVGAAIGVPGPPDQAVANGFKAPDMSAQVLQLIDRVIEVTRDTMGASDAALGNVRPDNTSAIIATQKATSMPLEMQKQDFYSFVEDSVRIWMDMMVANYGVRMVKMKIPAPEDPPAGLPGMGGGTGWMAGAQAGGLPAMAPALMQPLAEERTEIVPFDFSQLAGENLKLNVEIGAATYWSELMQVQTLDNLFGKGLVDAETYLENMPRGYIPARAELLESLRAQQAKAQQAAMAQADMAQPAGQPAGAAMGGGVL